MGRNNKLSIFQNIKVYFFKLFYTNKIRYDNCLQCGKKLTGIKRKFCSPECSKLYTPNTFKIKSKSNNSFEDDYILHKIYRDAYNKVPIPKKQICQICQEKLALERHHEDYNKPLEVTFVCKNCHEFIHSYWKKNNIDGKLNLMKGGKK